ncbi:hypothetical protein [Agreia bicolorata]|nr:hypothetical protein [Agreia bicolorata]
MAAGSVLIFGLATPAAAAPISQASGEEVGMASCASEARQVVSGEGVEPTAGYDYACVAGSVTVTVDPGTQNERRLTNGETAATDQEPSEAQRAVGLNCDPATPPNRRVVSELDAFAQFCIFYGQVDHPQNGTWTRSIWVTWHQYPGWNSAQSQINTQSNEGAPELSGTVSSRRQNGIFPPTVISSSLWSNNGNMTTTGWVVGGLTTGGSHSLAINDMNVTDFSKGFSLGLDDEISSLRFTCDSELERCFYPNSQEAPL